MTYLPRGSREPFRIGVLASGAGTNLQALLDTVHNEDGIEVAAVASNDPDAGALKRAREVGVELAGFPVQENIPREVRDHIMADWLSEHGADLVVLAGYMRLLSPAFLDRFPQAVINVHPALLPAFPGVRAIEQALACGVKVFGVTVHFVDEGVDSGPVIFQRAIELPHATDPEEVHAALRPLEHELLPAAVRALARGAVSLDPENPRRVIVEG